MGNVKRSQNLPQVMRGESPIVKTTVYGYHELAMPGSEGNGVFSGVVEEDGLIEQECFSIRKGVP